MSSITLLHVEDDPDDAFFLARTLAKAQPHWKVQRVSNGEQALAYLQGTGEFNDRQAYPLPELLILDLKLPGVNGFEVLGWVRAQAALSELPVLILSGSSLEGDRLKAAGLGASGYMVKSSDYSGVVEAALGVLRSGEACPAEA